MSKHEIREPKQKRAIEKKQSIVSAGYKLFCECGYYHTNTAEIARAAGVSTGIVYNYFADKEDILLAVVSQYISTLKEQFQRLFTDPVRMDNIPSVIGQLIDTAVASHTMNVKAHNEFMAMACLNEDIARLFSEFEAEVAEKLFDLLTNDGISGTNLPVKIKLCFGMIEHLCHDLIQNKPPREEQITANAITIRLITTLLKDEI